MTASTFLTLFLHLVTSTRLRELIRESVRCPKSPNLRLSCYHLAFDCCIGVFRFVVMSPIYFGYVPVFQLGPQE